MAFTVSENLQGSTDLNADGDNLDEQIVLDFREGVATSNEMLVGKPRRRNLK